MRRARAFFFVCAGLLSVFGDNIRHALQYLETGAVDVAIIALSIAGAPYVWSYDHLQLLFPLALTAGG